MADAVLVCGDFTHATAAIYPVSLGTYTERMGVLLRRAAISFFSFGLRSALCCPCRCCHDRMEVPFSRKGLPFSCSTALPPSKGMWLST